MCNLYTTKKSVDEVSSWFRKLQMPLHFPEGIPNLQPKDIAITDPGPIVRAATGDTATYELVIRRWSWPGPGGKPVFNFRSEGREFSNGRGLIVADGFYEFTAPMDAKQKRKRRWLFSAPDEGLIGIAGLWRKHEQVGEAFTMLTCEPGPDVAPYHDRQVAVLTPDQWRDWLDPAVDVRGMIRPLAPGSLRVN